MNNGRQVKLQRICPRDVMHEPGNETIKVAQYELRMAYGAYALISRDAILIKSLCLEEKCDNRIPREVELFCRTRCPLIGPFA